MFSPTQLQFIHLDLQHYELFKKQIKVVSFLNNNDNTSNIIIKLDFPWQVVASSVGEQRTKVFCSEGYARKVSVCGFTTPKALFTLRQIIPSGNVLICHQTKLSPRFTRLAIKSPIRDAASNSMNEGQYTRDKTQGFYVNVHFSSFAKCWSHLSYHATFPFLSGLIYFANMLTPDTVEQNLLAAPLSATTNTQLLICKSNAEQKIIFTCVVTITQFQNTRN